MADSLVALADFDRQRLWVHLGHASVFYYLHCDLKLSKGAAHYRKVAARLIQTFPEVVAPFQQGKLCITTVVELARVITPGNSTDVLPRFFYLSKQEAKAVAVEICPAAVVPRREVVTKVVTEVEAEVPRAPPFQLDETPLTPCVQAAPQAVPMQSEPLTPNLQRLHMAQQAKRRAEVKKPQKNPRPPKNPGRVPAAVRRAVWARDDGTCQWPLDSGGVCGSTLRLEIDHVAPRGKGGLSTIDNCRLACAFHNQLAARQVYGDKHMDLFTRTVPVAREAAAPWIGLPRFTVSGGAIVPHSSSRNFRLRPRFPGSADLATCS